MGGYCSEVGGSSTHSLTHFFSPTNYDSRIKYQSESSELFFEGELLKRTITCRVELIEPANKTEKLSSESYVH